MSYGVIYKITNNVNGKMYIGQTSTSLDIRINQHIVNSSYKDGVLYNAIRKYSWKNFSYEKIDEAINEEELHAKEIFYIEKYRSFCGFKDSNGYNVTLGGDGTRGNSEKLTIEDVAKIKDMIANTFHSLVEIADMFNVTFNCISSIYTGRTWNYVDVKGFSPNMERNSFVSQNLKLEDVIEIKKMLSTRRYKMKEVAEVFGISKSHVSAINTGKIYPYVSVEGFENSTDNIGENNGMSKLTKEKVIEIRELYNNGVRNIDIAKKYGIHELHVSDICKGICWNHIKDGINEEGKNFKGENNPSAKLTTDNVKNIRELLNNTTLTIQEIGNKYNISKHMISKINTGKAWMDEGLTYPIRKKGTRMKK